MHLEFRDFHGNSLREKDCRCRSDVSLFINDNKSLLEDACQKEDLETLKKMGDVLKPVGQYDSALSSAARKCHTQCFLTMCRATQSKLTLALNKHKFNPKRLELEAGPKTQQELATELLITVKNEFQDTRGSQHHTALDDTIRKIEINIETLKNEQEKLKKDDFLLSVFGAYNAGKSTTINAIIGMNIVPTRRSAMTVIPTVIRHKPGKKQPELNLGDKIDTLNDLLFTLHKEMAEGVDKKNNKLKENSEIIALKNNKELKEVLKSIEEQKPGYKFFEQLDKAEEEESKALNYKAEESEALKKVKESEALILNCLRKLNYVIRILEKVSGESDKINFDIEKFLQDNSFPVVELEFTALNDVGIDHECSFSLMDTPGLGEFKGKGMSSQVLKFLEKLLLKSHTAIAVVDSGDLDGVFTNEIYDKLEEFAKSQPNNGICVWVNKIDEEKSKERVSTQKLLVKQSSTIPMAFCFIRLQSLGMKPIPFNLSFRYSQKEIP